MTLHFDIERAVNEVRLLFDAHPEIMEDSILTENMVEGSTSLPELIDKLVRTIRDTRALEMALADEINYLKERKDRFQERQERLRTTIFKLMQMANIRKMERPLGTVSISHGRPKVIITDESLLPEDCIRIKREPNKERIATFLKSGDTVAGATLSNAEEMLVIR